MIHDWDITETNQARAARRKLEVAVLPIGAIEPHNFHLPMGMDYRHTAHVARAAVARAAERTDGVLLLPPLPYGADCNLMAFPIAVHVAQDVVDAMVRQIAASMAHYGCRKFVIINGHGGNDFIPLVRQLQPDLDIHAFLVDWWKVAADRYGEIFTRPDDHAGQFETSVALALFPELVELANAGDGAVHEFRFEAMRKGWVRTSRDFGRLSDQCAAGNPEGASAERGRQVLELVITRIGDFLAELAESPIDEAFPFRGD